MARIRSIKPDFFRSPTIARLSLRARLTFAGIWCYVDDEGRGYDEPRLIKAEVWPLDDDVTHGDVADDIAEIEAAGLVERWIDGRPLLRVRSFREHQLVNRPTKSKLPPSPEEQATDQPTPPTTHGALTEPSRNCPGAVTDGSPGEVEEEREEEGKRKRRGRQAATPPPATVVSARNLEVTAGALVTQRHEEIPTVVGDLIAKHGHDPTVQAINDLHGRAFTWPSELRKAAEKQLARRAMPAGSGPQRSPPNFDDDPTVDPTTVRTAVLEARSTLTRKATG